MTRTTQSRRPHPHAPHAQHVYLPHSSWTRVERKAVAENPIAPEDFWARLGI